MIRKRLLHPLSWFRIVGGVVDLVDGPVVEGDPVLGGGDVDKKHFVLGVQTTCARRGSRRRGRRRRWGTRRPRPAGRGRAGGGRRGWRSIGQLREIPGEEKVLHLVKKHFLGIAKIIPRSLIWYWKVSFTCSIKAMAILILCQRKMKRQTTTRKMMPTTEVNASQVSRCFKKSSTISGVQFSCISICRQGTSTQYQNRYLHLVVSFYHKSKFLKLNRII